nr:hypothetical protein [Moraxella osloensis]
MKDKLFTLLGKFTFAVLCILAFLAVGKFVGHGIVTAWDRQAQFLSRLCGGEESGALLIVKSMGKWVHAVTYALNCLKAAASLP